MKKYLAALLLGGLAQTAQAISFYDPITNILNIDSVVANGVQYNNVSIVLYGYGLLGIGPSTPYIADSCTTANLTNLRYNAIGIGMSLYEVNSIFGCKYDPNIIYRSSLATTYTWVASPAIVNVFFDPYTLRVKDIGGGIFKQGQGF
jgi:hypothetical protein